MTGKDADKLVKLYDRNLYVHWNDHLCRWQISNISDNGDYYRLLIIQTEDGKYREVHECDVAKIAQMDKVRQEKCKNILKYIEDKNDELEESRKKKLTEEIRQISKDRWRSIFGVPYVRTGCPWKK
jgi:hypothetical protein